MAGAVDRSIAEILTDIGRHAREIVRAEFRLARLEAQAEIKTAGQGAILLAAGGTVSLLALALLSMAGVYLLATVVAVWIAALIMAAVGAAIGGLLITAGLKHMRKVTLTMPRTVAAIKETVEWAKPSAR
jgi:high-affinity K+ transport system ATPase subunit B